jgi:hypothetical protein
VIEFQDQNRRLDFGHEYARKELTSKRRYFVVKKLKDLDLGFLSLKKLADSPDAFIFNIGLPEAN